jgi:hypothetical protein
MNERRDNLPDDIKVLRYLDALNEGDLEAVAALWEEAASDPRLEHSLAELDSVLFSEEVSASCQKPEKRPPEGHREPEVLTTQKRSSLRALRRPLIAASLAAACLMIVLSQRWRYVKDPRPIPVNPYTLRVNPPPSEDSASIAALLKARREWDEAATTTFTWPLPETQSHTFSTSIPPDLLD